MGLHRTGGMGLIHDLEAVQAERGHLDEESLRSLSVRTGTPLYRLQELVSFYPHFRTRPAADVTVAVCRDVSCWLNGGERLAGRIASAVAGEGAGGEGAGGEVEILEASCLGCCELAPAVRVNGTACSASDLPELIERIRNPDAGPAVSPLRRWRVDPYEKPEDRYGALRAALEGTGGEGLEGVRDRMVESLEASGLRGMGGAGFPTGRKWAFVRAEAATPKYVVCNADESEPGTFKDRVIMEELPWLVLEGMVLGGLAVGAERGTIYLRHEYGRARDALETEIARMRRAGLLGPDILGSGIDLDLDIFVSPGGYILGEETALLEALEDRRGEPRNKPPFPGRRGLWGQPTLINNVETLAFVPAILLRGAEWWRAEGRDGHAGLKFMAVSGHVERPGVYEIPMGTTVAELIELAGGVSGGRELKAFAPGGASSQFLPSDRADVPIDFGDLAEAGSMMGSGALVVAAEGTRMLPLAANVVRFFRNESCGKCVPCRDGTEKAVRMLDAALEGERPLDWDTIQKLDLLLSETSICGLGYVALNPLTSAARWWPGEIPRSGGNGAGAADGGGSGAAGAGEESA